MVKRNTSKGRPAAGPLAADFSEFGRPSREDWREEAEKALGGAPFDKVLVTRTIEGFPVQPLPDAADLEGVAHRPGLSGLAAARPPGAPFLVAESVDLPEPAAAGHVLAEELERGLTAIRLALHPASCSGLDPEPLDSGTRAAPGIALRSVEDLALVLGSADPAARPIQILADETALGLLALVAAHARAIGADERLLRGCVAADPLGKLARTGGLDRSLDACYRDLAACAAWATAHAPDLRVVAARGAAFGDGGASAVEELACVMATAVSYLRALEDRGIGPSAAAAACHFEFTIGPDFFMEVAKLRAARLLWGRVLEACGVGQGATAVSIHACTGRLGKTLLDPHVNMLRATTEAFSAAVGGADSIETLPYDALWRTPDEFSRRVARNTQVVLREEAGLGRVADPAGGSYYTEWLTDQVACRAWELFREIERAGGMAAALAAGLPQGRIAATAAARRAALGARKTVLVGTNQYADADERICERRQRGGLTRAATGGNGATAIGPAAGEALARLAGLAGEAGVAVVETAIRAAAAGAHLGEITAAAPEGERPTVAPIPTERLAEPYERLRLRAETHAAETGALPAVFLANIGPLAEHKARADFGAAFFQPGGFQVISGPGAGSPQAAAEEAAGSGAGIAVLCSTDDNYPKLVGPFCARLRELAPQIVAVLAGYPKDQVEAHRRAGIDEFIHARADNLDLLKRLFERTGVA
jgi:methylmalonyl-CoA mutase